MGAKRAPRAKKHARSKALETPRTPVSTAVEQAAPEDLASEYIEAQLTTPMEQHLRARWGLPKGFDVSTCGRPDVFANDKGKLVERAGGRPHELSARRLSILIADVVGYPKNAPLFGYPATEERQAAEVEHVAAARAELLAALSRAADAAIEVCEHELARVIVALRSAARAAEADVLGDVTIAKHIPTKAVLGWARQELQGQGVRTRSDWTVPLRLGSSWVSIGSRPPDYDGAAAFVRAFAKSPEADDDAGALSDLQRSAHHRHLVCTEGANQVRELSDLLVLMLQLPWSEETEGCIEFSLGLFRQSGMPEVPEAVRRLPLAELERRLFEGVLRRRVLPNRGDRDGPRAYTACFLRNLGFETGKASDRVTNAATTLEELLAKEHQEKGQSVNLGRDTD